MSEGPSRAVERPRPAVWRDDGPVVDTWAPPPRPGPAPEPARITPAVLYGVILLALVLIAASIWGLGGLKKRTDNLLATAPGALITTGPYELKFDEVTAQRTTSYDDSIYWKVTMIGSGRTTGSVTIAPSWTGNGGMFVSKDDRSQEIAQPSGAGFGAGDSSATAFTPGLAPVPYSVEFKYSDRYQPGPTLRVLVFELDYYDNSLLGDGDEAWHNSEYAHQLLLPVRVLPEDTY